MHANLEIQTHQSFLLLPSTWVGLCFGLLGVASGSTTGWPPLVHSRIVMLVISACVLAWCTVSNESHGSDFESRPLRSTTIKLVMLFVPRTALSHHWVSRNKARENKRKQAAQHMMKHLAAVLNFLMTRRT